MAKRKNLTKNARKGFRFLKDNDEIYTLQVGQKVNYCFYSNLTISQIDHENKIVFIKDNEGNEKAESFYFIEKYLEIEINENKKEKSINKIKIVVHDELLEQANLVKTEALSGNRTFRDVNTLNRIFSDTLISSLALVFKDKEKYEININDWLVKMSDTLGGLHSLVKYDVFFYFKIKLNEIKKNETSFYEFIMLKIKEDIDPLIVEMFF